MSLILKHKREKLEKQSQFIFIDNQGFVTDSCDSIFKTDGLLHQHIAEWFPFLESIYDHVAAKKVEEPEFRFSRLNAPFSLLPGIYDFVFSKVLIEGKEVLLWEIHDYTTLYEEFIRQQQACNEIIIKSERINAIQKVLQTQRINLSKRNADLEQLQKIRTKYYKKIEGGILQIERRATPHLLAKKIKDRETIDYITAIEHSLLQAKDFVEELIILTNAQDNYEFTEQSFEIYDLLNTISFRFDEEHANSNIELSISVHKDIPEKMIGNFTYLKHLIGGLILNYAKIIQAGIIEIQLAPTTIQQANLIKIKFYLQSYSINGKLPIYLGKVKRFNNHDNHDFGDIKSEIELRLSIIRHFVEQHQGKFSVESDEDNGVGISFTFPYVLSEEKL